MKTLNIDRAEELVLFTALRVYKKGLNGKVKNEDKDSEDLETCAALLNKLRPCPKSHRVLIDSSFSDQGRCYIRIQKGFGESYETLIPRMLEWAKLKPSEWLLWSEEQCEGFTLLDLRKKKRAVKPKNPAEELQRELAALSPKEALALLLESLEKIKIK